VAIVKSSLQLLAMKPRSSEMYLSGLEVCLEDCVRLENTVLQMLTLARVEYAPVRSPDNVVQEMCAMAACVEESMRQFTSLAELREVRVTLATPEHTDVLLGAKECAILCSNLLHNALQHSPAGSEIKIELVRGQGWLTLSVEDRGEGIALEILPHVFEPFYRGDASRDRKSGGTGLGLTICKAICDEAGGSISIASEVGAGTQVMVRLPS
jgi:signal transduction histidine kinase